MIKKYFLVYFILFYLNTIKVLKNYFDLKKLKIKSLQTGSKGLRARLNWRILTFKLN